MSAPRSPVLGASIAAAIGIGVCGALCYPYTVDDAHIVARIAEHIAAGHGYVMNVGQAPADGVTGPLWLLPGIVATALAFDPLLVAKQLGFACMVCTVLVLTMRLGRRACGRTVAVVAACMLATQPTLASWAVAGLETGAATLALGTLALPLLVHAAPGAAAFTVAAATVPWLRPELVPAAAVAIALTRRRQRELAHGAALALGASVVAVVAFRIGLFGHALPISAAAKPADLGTGLEYVARATLVTTGGGGLVLAAVGWRKGQARDRALGGVLVAHLIALVFAGGDWMPGFRLLAPVVPLYAILAAVGFAWLWRRNRPGIGAGAALLLALALAVPALDLVLRVEGARDTARSRQTVGERIVADLRERTTTVAMVDVGFLARRSGVTVVDLGGVTDATIAHLPGGHLDKRIDEALLRARNPDAIVLHGSRAPTVDGEGRLQGLAGYPVERRVAAMAWVREAFVVGRVYDYAPNYHYVLLVRRQGP